MLPGRADAKTSECRLTGRLAAAYDTESPANSASLPNPLLRTLCPPTPQTMKPPDFRPAPSPATYEYFCRHLPEILRGSLPNWRLIEVGVNSDSVLMFKYEHRQTQSLYHLFALPPQSFSFLLELPRTEYGPTPPCQISSYYWGSATGFELCVAITEYFGTFTRHTQLVPTLDTAGDYATLLDITEIHGY